MPVVPFLPAIATVGAAGIGAVAAKNSADTAAGAMKKATAKTSAQKEMEKQLYELLSGKTAAGTPSYTGSLTAPMSSYETQGLDLLNQYLKQSPSSMYGLAGDELTKTMQGAYDPASSPFYQAMRTSQMANLEEAKKGLGSDLSARGLFYSPARTKGLADLNTNTTNSLNTLLGQMAETERARRLSAVPTAMSLGAIEENRPAVMAQMALQLGSLPRTIEQADLTAKYGDYLKGLDLDQNNINNILAFLGKLQGNQALGMQGVNALLGQNAQNAAVGTSVGNAASDLFNSIYSALNQGNNGGSVYDIYGGITAPSASGFSMVGS